MFGRLFIAWICLLLSVVLQQPCRGAASSAPPSPERSLADALLFVQTGRFEEALLPLRQLYAPPLRDALTPQWQRRLPFLLGYAYFRTGDYRRAALHLEQARAGYPELRDYTLWLLGEALLHLGRAPQARTAFRGLLEAFPESVHRREASFKAAEASLLARDFSPAVDLLTRYQQEYPDSARHGEVHIRLGMAYRDMGNPEGALSEWRHVWLDHPEDPAAMRVPDLERSLPATFLASPIGSEQLMRRAQRLYRLNRHREAVQAFELARAAIPDRSVSDETLYHIGMAQYHARENSDAAETFRQVLERAPRGPFAASALFMLARLHLRTETDDLFLATAKALMTQFPGSKQAEEVGYLLGHFHRNRGRIPEGIQVFSQIVQQGKGAEFAENATWYLGWTQYGIRQYQQATKTWGRLLSTFPASALVPDALYWQGRAFERQGQHDEARSRYERLRTSYAQTYYGHLAAARLAGRAAWSWDARGLEPLPESIGRNASIPESLPNSVSNAHAVRGAELWAMRLFAEAGEEFHAVPSEGAATLLYQWRAAQAFHWAGHHHRALSILRRSGRGVLLQAAGVSLGELQEMTFPITGLQRLDAASLAGLDPLFLGALIMAESNWNPRALSPVGARGLMQLMPETGRRVAQGMGVSLASDDQLFDTVTNLKLGIMYLRDLLQRFEQQLPLAAASYNAGEEEVGKWWARRGDMDMEEFIANIPFRETRQYVQRIFVYYATYQKIYRALPG